MSAAGHRRLPKYSRRSRFLLRVSQAKSSAGELHQHHEVRKGTFLQRIGKQRVSLRHETFRTGHYAFVTFLKFFHSA